MPDDLTHDHAPDPSGTVRPPAGLPPSVILAKASSAATPVANEWSPPGFAIEQELGRGGMGVVYLAYQTGLNRPVALKLIKAGEEDAVSVLRFLAEAEAMAAVRHPNVAQVYQYGEHQGRPFLALEYCNGGSLHDRIKATGPFPPSEAATLIAAIADGVEAAHAAGIVHRDLKPANILFSGSRREDRGSSEDRSSLDPRSSRLDPVPKVTDFGLAKRNAGDHLTATQAIMGTPAYMSPEQARGAAKFADPRADVWAIGVMLYELLAGRQPFVGETPLDVLRQVLDTTPAGVRTLSAVTPRDLELICDKCLRKDAAERYVTAGEMAADVRRYLAGEPIAARPVSKTVQAWKWAKRNKLAASSLVGAMTAVCFILGLGVALLIVMADRTRQVNDALGLTETAAKAAREEATRADAEKAVAQKNEQAARRQLGRMAVAEGFRRADAGDGNEALAWFARARRLVPEDAGDDLAADRIASFRQLDRFPALVGLDDSEGAPAASERFGSYELRIENDAARKVYAARVWDTATGRPVSPPLAHAREVWAAAFSPDGRRVATASDDHTARVWDAATGQPVTPPLPHAEAIDAVAFSPDGRRVATASEDNTARVWDAESGRPITPPLTHANLVRSVAFSPDGRRVVTASLDKTARVWDATTGTPATPPLAHGNPVRSAAFSPDGRRVATTSFGNTARVWNAATGRPVTPPLPYTGEVRSVTFGPDGRQLRVAATGRPVSPPLVHAREVWAAERGPDGRQVATGGKDRTTRVWDTAGGRSFTPPLAHAREVWAAVFSPDGQRAATASGDRTARVWDAATGQPVSPPLVHDGVVLSVAFSPDGRRVLTVGEDKFARVWDVATGAHPAPPLAHADRIWSAVFSPDGRRVVTASRDNTARVWDAETGRPVTPPLTHTGWVWSAAYSPDGRRVVTASQDNTARVWDAETGQALAQPLTHAGAVAAAAFSPDGRRVLTASFDNTARVWDAATGQPVTTPLTHTGVVGTAAFSPDGRRVVTASFDNTGRVWDAETGHPLTPPLAHAGLLWAAAFSPDGRRVATASFDHTARVWDTATGLPVTPPLVHAGWVRSAAFSPDGRRLVTASGDGTARLWELPTDTRPSDDLIGFAHLSAGGQIDTFGGFVPLTADETKTLFTALTAKYPADFAVTPARATAWHREQAADAERDRDWFAVSFHLRALLRAYAFADVELAMRRRAAEAKVDRR